MVLVGVLGFFLANFGCMSMSGLLSTGEDQ